MDSYHEKGRIDFNAAIFTGPTDCFSSCCSTSGQTWAEQTQRGLEILKRALGPSIQPENQAEYDVVSLHRICEINLASCNASHSSVRDTLFQSCDMTS